MSTFDLSLLGAGSSLLMRAFSAAVGVFAPLTFFGAVLPFQWRLSGTCRLRRR